MASDPLAVLVQAGADAWWFECADGAQLRVSRYSPDPTPDPGLDHRPRGTLLLLHGFGEFTEKYLPSIARLRALGLAVLTLDWRSQGRSTRYAESERRGYVRDFETLLDDVMALARDPRCQVLGAPVWILGHPMGGMLALRLMERWTAVTDEPQTVRGLILSAPMLGIYRLPRWFLAAVARAQVWRGKAAEFAWGAGELDPDANENRITSDSQRFAEIMKLLRDEPLLRTHGATWGWLNAAARLMKGALNKATLAAYEHPILLLSPSNDVIVDADLHRKFAARCSACRYVQLTGSCHEPMQEQGAIQDAFYTEVEAFLNSTAVDPKATVAGDSAATDSSADHAPSRSITASANP
ncbi:MAG: alpha/beta hydrolase [Pseudomonadota bacterium]